MDPSALVTALRAALAGATSPSHPIFAADETAGPAPCWQYELGTETQGEQSTKAQYDHRLPLYVTARGTTPAERDAMVSALRAVALGSGALGAFEIEWSEIALALPQEQVGERTYPATHQLVAQFFSAR